MLLAYAASLVSAEFVVTVRKVITDGPYRESQAPLVRAKPMPIVRADEAAPPTRRFRITDYSDGSAVVRFWERDPSPLSEHPDPAKFKAGLVMFPLMCVASLFMHLYVPAGIVFAIWALSVQLAFWHTFARVEIVVGPSGVGLRRDGHTHWFLPDSVEGFAGHTRLRAPDATAPIVDGCMLAIDEHSWLTVEESDWLAERLGRALARAKQAPNVR